MKHLFIPLIFMASTASASFLKVDCEAHTVGNPIINVQSTKFSFDFDQPGSQTKSIDENFNLVGFTVEKDNFGMILTDKNESSLTGNGGAPIGVSEFKYFIDPIDPEESFLESYLLVTCSKSK